MIEKIKLTEEEQVFWNKIFLDQPSRESEESSCKLAKNLLNRKVIPQIRQDYFTKPKYNIGGRGKSRMEVFQQKGINGEEIFKHLNFHKYLRYFILGPALPLEVIQEFNALVDENKPVTSGDQKSFCILARNQVRQYLLDSKKVSEEYFKLCLELNLDIDMAKEIRNIVKRMKQ